MKLFFSADNDIDLLPFFVEHYQKLGFSSLYCCTNTKLVGYDFIKTFPWGEVDGKSHFVGWDTHFNRMIHESIDSDEWYGLAELDEFHYYNGESISDVIKKCDEQKKTHVFGHTIDRVASNGKLPKLKREAAIYDQFPLVSQISTKILRACSQKVMLCKGKKLISCGKHLVMDDTECFRGKYSVWHFKWHENVIKRMEEKLRFASDDGSGWLDGNRKCLDYWNKHKTVLV